ncbi:hypothetical protein [Brachyspira murdochii]|uniref:Uncharacterized protein n=1 Tax=Brachyspira murdochii TaxID=84378 RepID=A0ABX5B6K5_9SPIR|nr:hypothetical protein [Brachyspira murdochii]PPS22955.1 hypothetical protein DJ52_01800 [Brachyspira murdochii]
MSIDIDKSYIDRVINQCMELSIVKIQLEYNSNRKKALYGIKVFCLEIIKYLNNNNQYKCPIILEIIEGYEKAIKLILKKINFSIFH